MRPDAADLLPWWQKRFALEGLEWEASARSEDGLDVWPDERGQVVSGSDDELAALGIDVRQVGG